MVQLTISDKYWKRDLSDGEIIEIITHVAMNIFTNLLGKATPIEIDFPEIELNKAA